MGSLFVELSRSDPAHVVTLTDRCRFAVLTGLASFGSPTAASLDRRDVEECMTGLGIRQIEIWESFEIEVFGGVEILASEALVVHLVDFVRPFLRNMMGCGNLESGSLAS